MEQATQVVFRKNAAENIAVIALYIADKGSPKTAQDYRRKLYSFGNSLSVFPDKYPVCRFEKFAKRNLHCAVFDSTYIFTYKVVNHKLVIYNVIHGKRLK